MLRSNDGAQFCESLAQSIDHRRGLRKMAEAMVGNIEYDCFCFHYSYPTVRAPAPFANSRRKP
jgi:hypothetical protein